LVVDQEVLILTIQIQDQVVDQEAADHKHPVQLGLVLLDKVIMVMVTGLQVQVVVVAPAQRQQIKMAVQVLHLQ
jgi:hypothetical protein